MSNTTLEDLGKLVLRLAIGLLLLFHGLAKLFHGIGPIEAMVAARGLPAFFAWAVYIGEVIAPLCLILGLYTRMGGLLIVANMLVAIVLAHMGHLAQFTGSGGWRLELQGLYLFGGLAVAMLGAGRFSAGGRGGRWN
ncbi:DoxX family protein [Pollutimonas harenae]|uniref:DoxX family protein n=1 Tax=Pollutimonas harenae TaxID=657015 RepID=A0A853H792_9BURK|nr:DoxX family protein [Pollutimonas harenae]NYT86373.1 DoxX family protein [Pollutimonas harenae]TEA69870.1 DoxX family protein [Pollutimonas harenae]